MFPKVLELVELVPIDRVGCTPVVVYLPKYPGHFKVLPTDKNLNRFPLNSLKHVHVDEREHWRFTIP